MACERELRVGRAQTSIAAEVTEASDSDLGVPNDERLFGTVRLHNGGHNTAPGLVKVSSKTQH
jgi:hypothetical protein